MSCAMRHAPCALRSRVGAAVEEVSRVGFIGASSASRAGHYLEAFRQGLRDLGYVEGENIVIDVRWAEGSAGRFPRLISRTDRTQGRRPACEFSARCSGGEKCRDHDSCCLCNGDRPHRVWPHRQPRSAWWQYHEFSRAAYDLKKLRAKNLLIKFADSRRYSISTTSYPYHRAACDPARKGSASHARGVGKPKMGRKPKNWSPIDQHYEAIRQDMFILFHDLRIAA